MKNIQRSQKQSWSFEKYRSVHTCVVLFCTLHTLISSTSSSAEKNVVVSQIQNLISSISLSSILFARVTSEFFFLRCVLLDYIGIIQFFVTKLLWKIFFAVVSHLCYDEWIQIHQYFLLLGVSLKSAEVLRDRLWVIRDCGVRSMYAWSY